MIHKHTYAHDLCFVLFPCRLGRMALPQESQKLELRLENDDDDDDEEDEEEDGSEAEEEGEEGAAAEGGWLPLHITGVSCHGLAGAWVSWGEARMHLCIAAGGLGHAVLCLACVCFIKPCCGMGAESPHDLACDMSCTGEESEESEEVSGSEDEEDEDEEEDEEEEEESPEKAKEDEEMAERES